MSKLRFIPLLVVATLFLSACTSTKHHIGMWVEEEGRAPDTDQDGVLDPDDRCLSTPAGLVVDEVGCSYDDDQDGVLNDIDQCPDTPLGRLVDMVGCSVDDDGDGVMNQDDQCPNTPPNTEVDVLGCKLDSDGDGVVDADDRCPNTPPNTLVDARGCHLDSDGDGVLDYMDRCPNTPTGMKVDCNGCSDEVIELPSLNGLHFDRNKATLKSEALSVLNRVVDTMQRYPDLAVKVVGHTDSRGKDAYNLDLSWRRARSVVEFLVSKGIEKQRLQSEGRGEREPIAENTTSEGRAKNRRVEFVVLD